MAIDETERTQLEQMNPPKAGITTTTTVQRDLLVVNYAVPAEQAQSLLPPGLTAERLPDAEGNIVAFLQVRSALHTGVRWSLLPENTGTAYRQVSYRLLTRRDKTRSAYVLRTFVSTSELHLSKRALDRETDFARFEIFTEGDPARGTYQSYRVRAFGDKGDTSFTAKTLPATPDILPVPFRSSAEMIGFLFDRPDVYYPTAIPTKSVGITTIEHSVLHPTWGELTSARSTLAIEWQLLTPDELLRPLCVWLQGEITTVSHPSRYAKLPKE